MFVMLQWNKLASEQNLRFSFSKNPNYFFLFLRSNTIFFYFCNQIRSRCFHPWTRYFSRWKVLRGICEEVARNAAERTFPGPGHRISKRRMSAHSPSEMRRQRREPFFCNFSDTHIASCLWNSSSCYWLISPAECVVCSVLCGVLVFFKSEKVQALFTTLGQCFLYEVRRTTRPFSQWNLILAHLLRSSHLSRFRNVAGQSV